jgi:hypothetical protein
MSVCQSCGGVLGRDCFNAADCAQITAALEMQPDEVLIAQLAAERDQLRQQVEELISKIDTHRARTPDDLYPAQRLCRDFALYQAADQVRKELEGR